MKNKKEENFIEYLKESWETRKPKKEENILQVGEIAISSRSSLEELQALLIHLLRQPEIREYLQILEKKRMFGGGSGIG